MRRATIRTLHDDPAAVARAVRPDNTEDMRTRVRNGTLETRIDRESTGGLHTSVDDYLVNLLVAEETRRATETDNHTPTDITDQRQ